MNDEQNKTGIRYITENNGLIKYIDYDNKTVIYKINDFNRGIALCCAPLYEDEIKREQISSSTDGIFINK